MFKPLYKLWGGKINVGSNEPEYSRDGGDSNGMQKVAKSI